MRLVFVTLALALVTMSGGLAVPAGAQERLESRDLATYRLTEPTFRRFQDASRRIAEVTTSDSRFRFAPLFTREIVQSEDASSAAAQLMARLAHEPALAEALGAAGLTAREYTAFALTLIGARLAHGFLDSGALRAVPPGVPADNVAFVDAHLSEVLAVLHVLGVSA